MNAFNPDNASFNLAILSWVLAVFFSIIFQSTGLMLSAYSNLSFMLMALFVWCIALAGIGAAVFAVRSKNYTKKALVGVFVSLPLVVFISVGFFRAVNT